MATDRENIHENWDAMRTTAYRSLLMLLNHANYRDQDDRICIVTLAHGLECLFAEVDWLRDRVKQMNEEASAEYLLSRLAAKLEHFDHLPHEVAPIPAIRGAIVELICDLKKERVEKKQTNETSTSP
jgi:hypothetical protein